MEIERRLRCANKKSKSKPFHAKPFLFCSDSRPIARVTKEFQTKPCRRKPTRQHAQKKFWGMRNNVQNKATHGPPAPQEGAGARLAIQAAAGLKTEPMEIKNEPSSAPFSNPKSFSFGLPRAWEFQKFLVLPNEKNVPKITKNGADFCAIF